MTAIRPADIQRFIAGGAKGVAVVLVYGPDEGLVRTRVRALVGAALGAGHDPLSLVELDAAAINDDPPRLLDEANAISMFGGRRAIIVRDAGKLQKAAWQPLLEVPPLDSIVVLQADDLGKSAPLRVACEANSGAAALPCYAPSDRDIAELIEAKCRAAGITIAAPARAALLDLLGADHALSESEIDKLILYARGKLAIEVADVEAVVADASGGAGSEPLDLAFEGKLEAVELAAMRAMREGVNASGLLAMALNHAMLLRRLVGLRSAPNFEQAMKAERLFFRREDRVRRQVAAWDHRMLTRAIDTLATAQEQSRRTPALDEAVLVRALWSIALAARK
jgi:DNA polymerase-3 subunit delta